jgi:broad specificity phosphatase PhoE
MLYFVRHAESRYNSAEKVIEKEVGEHYLETEVYLSAKFDRKYLDVEITEEGCAQAEEAKEKLKDQEFDVILVSPLRRALHTCSIIFEGHQSKAPVIIEPAFR